MQYLSQTCFDHEISYARILQHENGVRVEVYLSLSRIETRPIQSKKFFYVHSPLLLKIFLYLRKKSFLFAEKML